MRTPEIVEQVVFNRAHRFQPIQVIFVDIDVAGRAGEAAAAQRQHFVDAGDAKFSITGRPALAPVKLDSAPRIVVPSRASSC